MKSTIEWTDYTFNPWQGCVEVSPACDNCYARRMAGRKIHFQEEVWGKDASRHLASEGYWQHPHAWNRSAEHKGVRQRVFCGSMCDVMEERRDLPLQDVRLSLYRLIEETPNLDWLLLTKRPQNYSRFLPYGWLKAPRPNVWLMTTCENQDYVWRVEALMKVPAVVHGVSAEPLFTSLTLPDAFLRSAGSWMIAGGESGPSKNRILMPTKLGWVRSLRDVCVAHSFRSLPVQAMGVVRAGWGQS